MPFMLRDVGQECFMLVFQGQDIGSVFSTDDDAHPWVATLHNDYCRPTSVLPNSFKATSHQFTSFRDLQAWLSIPAPADAVEVAA